MKPFNYDTRGHDKNSSKGKGFPRHLWNQPIALDEESATRMSMNRSYGKLAEWGNDNRPFLKYSHTVKWFRKHIGQNRNKVFSEFKQAWDAQPTLRKSGWSVEREFQSYVWEEHMSNLSPRYIFEKRFCPYMVDNQNRIQINPDYRPKRKKLEFDPEYVQYNCSILNSMEERLKKEHSLSWWLMGGDAVGPISFPQPLWIIHPKTNQPVKASVSLIRLCIFEEKPKAGDVGLKYQISDDKLQYLKDEFKRVSVISGEHAIRGTIKVSCSGSNSFYPSFKEWVFVVRKSSL